MDKNPRAQREPHYCSERLKRKLESVRTLPVTIVEAPAGYGKTTAVRDYLERGLPPRTPVYWFTAADEEPASCFRRFAESIARIDSRAGQRLMSVGLPGATTTGDACDALRSITCGHETFLVADNFQYLLDALPPSFLAALVEHGGEDLHVVIIARTLSRAVLPVLAGHGVLHLTAADLRLDADDIARYYSQAGVGIPQECAEDLARTTGGWIVAVTLQLRTFRETGSFSGTPGTVALMEDLVWSTLDREQQEFLLCLSPFETVTVREACALGGFEELPDYALAALQHPFIRYEKAGGRYELDGVLSALLVQKRKERGAAVERACLRRAGDLCREEGRTSEALAFYARIKDYGQMLSLDVSHVLLDSVGNVPFSDLALDIAHNCPAEVKRRHLLSMLRVAFALLMAGNMDAFGVLMEELAGMLEAERGVHSGLLAEWTLLSSFQSFPCLDEMTARLRQAAALFDGKTSQVVLPEAPWCFGDYSQLAEFHVSRGEADREADELEAYVELYSRLTNGGGRGADALFRAELAYYRGHIGDAEILAYKAMALAESSRQSILQISAARLLAEIAQNRSDTAGWRAAIDSMQRAASSTAQQAGVVRSVLDTVYGLLLAELEAPADMAEWLRNGEFSGRQLLPPMAANALYVHLLYLLLTGQSARLIGTLQAVPPQVSRRSIFSEILVSLLLAVGYVSIGDRATGASQLHHAAELAMPDGLVYLFASLAGQLGGLASELIEREYPALYGTYLAMKEDFENGRVKLAPDLSPDDLPEALTHREREVALLAAQGLRNSEIARKLGVAENTVRAHLRTAFAKLDIDRRAKLAEKLRT